MLCCLTHFNIILNIHWNTAVEIAQALVGNFSLHECLTAYNSNPQFFFLKIKVKNHLANKDFSLITWLFTMIYRPLDVNATHTHKYLKFLELTGIQAMNMYECVDVYITHSRECVELWFKRCVSGSHVWYIWFFKFKHGILSSIVLSIFKSTFIYQLINY